MQDYGGNRWVAGEDLVVEKQTSTRQKEERKSMEIRVVSEGEVDGKNKTMVSKKRGKNSGYFGRKEKTKGQTATSQFDFPEVPLFQTASGKKITVQPLSYLKAKEFLEIDKLTSDLGNINFFTGQADPKDRKIENTIPKDFTSVMKTEVRKSSKRGRNDALRSLDLNSKHSNTRSINSDTLNVSVSQIKQT
eukprot:jgi/Bigna1/126494/aug1.2_g1202